MSLRRVIRGAEFSPVLDKLEKMAKRRLSDLRAAVGRGDVVGAAIAEGGIQFKDELINYFIKAIKDEENAGRSPGSAEPAE